MENIQITGSDTDQDITMGGERHSSAEPSGWNMPRKKADRRIKENWLRLAGNLIPIL